MSTWVRWCVGPEAHQKFYSISFFTRQCMYMYCRKYIHTAARSIDLRSKRKGTCESKVRQDDDDKSDDM